MRIRKLGEIAVLKSGGTPSKSKPEYWGGNLPWVSAKDLKTPIIFDSIDHLSGIGFSESRIAPKNSILILVRGMTLHKDVPVCLAGRDLAFNQDIKAIVVSKHVNPKYLMFYLHSQKGNLLRLVDSAGHGTGRLDTELLKSFTIILPKRTEQNAIADLLSTWDESITTIELMLAAKEKKFKGLLQELFNRENNKNVWGNEYLKEICVPVTRKNEIKETNVLTSSSLNGLVSQIGYYKKSVSAEDLSGYYLLKKGDFAYNRSTSNGYPFGSIKRLDSSLQGVLSTLYFCFSISDKDRCYSDFFVYLFESGYLNKQLRKICQEGARSHGLLNISKKDFFMLQIPLPPLSLQKQISSILTTSRHEIDLLKKQLGAYQKQKRGLMQKLLTGRWRVKTKEA